jgi:hypothetical protein
MGDYIFEKVFGLLHQLGVEADMSCPVVAASPFGLHPLQELSPGFDLELSFPLLNEQRHRLVK